MNTIRKSAKRTAVAILGAMAVTIPAQQAGASVGGIMQDMFDVYLNVTPADSFETQRRGGLTLGRIALRSRISKPKLIQFDPPYFRGGCGGLDFYGGSASFINADQLKAALQDIASNALNYAFMLALEGLCPTCNQTMQKLRDWSNTINKQLADSCTAATKLVNKTNLDEYHESKMKEAQNNQAQKLDSEDFWSSVDNFISSLDSDEKSGSVQEGNAIWNAMNKTNLATWFGAFGDIDLKEVIMSLTGTVVVTTTDSGGNECANVNGDKEYCTLPFPSTMTVTEFIDGGDVAILRCGTDTVNCLHPTESEETEWKGFRMYVREILFGPPPSYTGGLIFKVRTGDTALTAAEASFVEAAPVPVYKMLMSVVNAPGALMTVGQHIEENVAHTLARQLVFENIDAVTKALKLADGMPLRDKMLDMIAKRVEEFRVRKGQYDEEVVRMVQLMQLVDLAARSARANNQSTIDKPVNGGSKVK